MVSINRWHQANSSVRWQPRPTAAGTKYVPTRLAPTFTATTAFIDLKAKEMQNGVAAYRNTERAYAYEYKVFQLLGEGRGKLKGCEKLGRNAPMCDPYDTSTLFQKKKQYGGVSSLVMMWKCSWEKF
ncbi:unnamed protein product [Arctia plantaginis]|uniref:Uncharacterized protein n=1 Tax=Arctia plantaginis TaxID=874455 RepID=A0A8S0YP79_ARCPL|nr:unnamed protein product [Arctia plantaginis]